MTSEELSAHDKARNWSAVPLRGSDQPPRTPLEGQAATAAEAQLARRIQLRFQLPAYLLWDPEIPPFVLDPEDERFITRATTKLGLGDPQEKLAEYIALAADPRAQLARWQNGRCALCGTGECAVEDHDHATGLTRGYLCVSCNVREGFAGHIAPFVIYRAFPPTALLRLSIRYRHPITRELDYGIGPRGGIAQAAVAADGAHDPPGPG